MKFIEKKLTWKIYNINETLLITKQVQLINCKKFATTAFYKDKNIFEVYLGYLRAKMLIYLVWKTKNSLFFAKKVIVLKIYLNFADIFSKKLAVKLFKRFDMNKYAIDLKPNKLAILQTNLQFRLNRAQNH